MNTKIKYIKKALLLLLLPLLIASCDSALDPEKDGAIDEKDIWNNTKRAFAYLNDTYNNIPNGYNRISNAMLASASDEAVNSYTASDINGFNDGRWNQFFLIENVWNQNYEGIRKANQFLEKVDRVPIVPTLNGNVEQLTRTKERMKGEAFFLRALFYFELVKRYGGVPLYTTVLTTDEAKVIERSSMEECMKRIVADCDSAYKRLPVAYVGTTAGFDNPADLGRATQGAARALKARAQLYWASPLHNPSNDLSRWEAAAKTAKEVIDAGNYTLIPFAAGESLGNIYYYIAGSSFGTYNKDIIFSTKYADSNGFEKINTPPSFGGSGYTNPTQNLVQAFGMKNGKAIDESGSSYDPQDPYKDRDPRFYMTIAHNGYNLTMNDHTAVLQTYDGGADATGQYRTATLTGYYLNKMMSKNAVWDGRTSNVNHTWVIMRYAELLLNYAEAANEASASPDESVYTALEQIRQRAGLDPYTITRGKTKEEMRKLIRNERQVELAFEEHRFFDVRRWRLFDDASQKQNLLNIKGVKITKTGTDTYTYSDYVVETRKFEEKMYLYPIPESERLKAPLTQNPGW